jgi:hypothetical protein
MSQKSLGYFNVFSNLCDVFNCQNIKLSMSGHHVDLISTFNYVTPSMFRQNYPEDDNFSLGN